MKVAGLTATWGNNPFPTKDNVVPASDGAGVVVHLGSKVSEFQSGDRVVVTFLRDHVSGPITREAILSSGGALVDGTLREYGIYAQHNLVRMAGHLDFREASGLPCAGLTAWSALYGGRPLRPGDVVVTQGTGGVSIFALQVRSPGSCRSLILDFQ